MSYSFTIHPDDKVIIVIFEGEVSFSELNQVRDDFHQHPEYHEYLSGVYDFRNAKKTLTPQELQALNKRTETEIHQFPAKGKWCSINTSPVETAYSSLYKHNLNLIHLYEVFSTVQGASDYLNIDLKKYLDQ
jgi:hypothetical protein